MQNRYVRISNGATANGDTVTVCAVQSSGNCDAIATTTNDFPTVNTTYNISVTDAKGGS